MSTANVESAQGFLEGFNRRDLDSAVRNCAEDFVLTDFPSGQQVKGAEGTKGWLGMWSQAFSDGLIGDMRFHDAGDAVIAEAVFAGTNDGPWGPMQPTGKRASMPFCAVWTFNDRGEMSTQAAYYDVAGLMAQLGP